MAVPAEALIQKYPDQEVVEVKPRYFDADLVNELAFARLRYRRHAEDILAANHNLLMDGVWDVVPIPVDALGTGRKTLEVGREHGSASEEYKQNFEGLEGDSERVYAEAFRKLTWEYYPGKIHQRAADGQYYYKGQSLTQITIGGLSPVAKKGEQPLRIDDYVEEATYTAIGSMSVDEPVSVLTVLECPDWVIEEYETNPKGAFYGYVPEISKLMLRGMIFDNDKGERVEEQLALPGDYITHDEVIMPVLEETGRVEPGTELTKNELHSKQFIDSEAGDVFEFASLLDAKASEVTGKNIFLGEEVPDDHPKDYIAAKHEAIERHKAHETKGKKLANYIINLVEKDVDRWAAESLVSNFVDKDMKAISLHNPDLAEFIYDKKTADGFREVARLKSLGKYEAAERLQQQVENEAPPISYCGAGSCGLERVNLSSPAAQRAIKKGLRGNQLHDTERSCPDCGQLTIHYDESGNKACTNPKCDAAEIKE